MVYKYLDKIRKFTFPMIAFMCLFFINCRNEINSYSDLDDFKDNLDIIKFNELSGKTYFLDNNWPGGSLTFYITGSGKQKAIMQIYGSGVCVIRNIIYSVKEHPHGIVLISDRYKRKKKPSEWDVLVLRIKKDDNIIHFSNNEKSINTGRFLDEPMILSWMCKRIDLNILNDENFDHSIFRK